MNVPLTEVPDSDEWAAHLAQDGKDGGCKATEIARTNGELLNGEVVKLEQTIKCMWKTKRCKREKRVIYA